MDTKAPKPGEQTMGKEMRVRHGCHCPQGPGGWAVRVRWTNAASISIAVVPYQADLRSRVSGKDPLAY